jgi:hypothetical protein
MMKLKCLAVLLFIPSVALALDSKCQPLLAQYRTLKDQATSIQAEILQLQNLYNTPHVCKENFAKEAAGCVEMQNAILAGQIKVLDLKRGIYALETQMTQFKCPYNP